MVVAFDPSFEVGAGIASFGSFGASGFALKEPSKAKATSTADSLACPLLANSLEISTPTALGFAALGCSAALGSAASAEPGSQQEWHPSLATAATR